MDLASELDRGLDRLGPGGHEIEPVQPGRGAGGQGFGELLQGTRGEHGGVDIAEGAQLLSNGSGDLLPPVPDVDYHRPAAGIQIALAVVALDPNPLGFDRKRKLLVQYPWEHRTWDLFHYLPTALSRSSFENFIFIWEYDFIQEIR